MRWDGFIAFVDIASGYEKFVCLYDRICDEFGLLVDIAWGRVISEGVVDVVGEIFPVGFIVVDEC